MEHYSFLETVSRLANSNWGQKFANTNDADKDLMRKPGELTAMACLELLHRFNEFIKAMGDRGECNRYAITKPTNAKAFPDVKVGDFLWSGDVIDGFSRFVVVAKDKDGYALIISCNWSDTYTPRPHYATEYDYTSLEETMLKDAKAGIKYAEDLSARAAKVIAAIEAGEDVTQFEERIDF